MAREMKDSGVAWVGKIPISWSCQKLKYFAKINSGEMISKEEYVCDGKFPIIGSNGEIGRTDKYNNFESVITTGRVGTVGSTHIAEESWITDNALIIRNRNIFQKFLAYIIPNFDFKYMLSGTAQPLITATKLKDQFIPVPSSEVQIEIVSLLDKKCGEIDAVLDKTRTSIEEYKKLKQAIITQAVTKGVRGDRPMKESGSIWFGLIPADWKMHRTKKLVTIEKRIIGVEGVAVLSITQKGIRPKDLSKNEGQFAESYANYQIVHCGDFAMNHMDLLTGWVDISQFEGVTSPDYRVFTMSGNSVNKQYYLYLFQMCYSNRVYYGLGQGVSGLGRWRLPAKQFLDFLITVPPIEEQNEIVDYLDNQCAEINALIQKKEQFLAELETYKKSLIYEYVTGKKEV